MLHNNHLQMIIFWMTVVVAVSVFGILIYSLIKHRKSTNILEIILAIVPIIALIAMVIPAVKLLMH